MPPLNKIKGLLSSKLLRDTAVYGLTNALFTGLPLLLMPFLVAIMAPQDYGIVDIFKSVSLVLTPILGLSTVQSVTRLYYDLKNQTFKVFCSSIIAFHLMVAVFAIALVGVFSLFIESKYLTILFLAILFFLFNQIAEILLSIYRVKRMTKRYLIIRLGAVFIDLTLLVIFYLFYEEYNWTYRVIPNVLSTTFIGLLALLFLHRQFAVSFQFNKPLLIKAIHYSAPLILHMIAGYVLNVGDRFLIVYYLGESELGNYSVAYQLGMSISFFFTSFNLAWTPTFFEWMKQGKHSSILKVKKIVFGALIVLGAFIIMGWMMFSNLIENVEQYSVSTHLVVIIVIAYLFYSFYRFNAVYFFYYKDTKRLAVITSISSVFCIGLNFILIPRYGLIGAGTSTLVTFIMIFIVVEYYGKKLG